MCQKGFNRKDDLKLPSHYDNNEKSFICELCQKGFSQRCNLLAHINTHTGEQPFICEVCQKGFCHKSNLRRHMPTHIYEKTFICEICEKGFSRNDDLKIHVLRHSGDKPFICESCQKGYHSMKDLKNHSHTHTDEKPFACEFLNFGIDSDEFMKICNPNTNAAHPLSASTRDVDPLADNVKKSPTLKESLDPDNLTSSEPLSLDVSLPLKPEPRRPSNRKQAKQKMDKCDEILEIIGEYLSIKKNTDTVDKFDLIGKTWSTKLRDLSNEQFIYAEKLINDTLYEAFLGNLHRNCSLNLRTYTQFEQFSCAPPSSNLQSNYFDSEEERTSGKKECTSASQYNATD